MVTLPLTLLSSLHTRCVSHQPALHKVATVSLHHVHGGSTRAQVHSQHLGSACTSSLPSAESCGIQRTTPKQSPGARSTRDHLPSHASVSLVFSVTCLYPPVKYMHSLSRVYTLPATHLYYRSCVCIPCHASVFLVMRMYPHAKHLYPSVTRLCTPSCHCHTSVYP